MVLVFILWVVALMGLLTLWTGREVRGISMLAEGYLRSSRGYFLAYSGFQEALVRLTLSDPAERWIPDGVEHTLVVDGTPVKVRIEGESEKVNVNLAMKDTLMEVFEGLGYTDSEELADALLDWKDADEVSRPRGAEADYYRSLHPPYWPADRSFQTLEELLWVRGINRKRLFGTEGGLIHRVTLWGGKVSTSVEGHKVPEIRPGGLYRIVSSTGSLTLIVIVRYLPHTKQLFQTRYVGEFYGL